MTALFSSPLSTPSKFKSSEVFCFSRAVRTAQVLVDPQRPEILSAWARCPNAAACPGGHLVAGWEPQDPRAPFAFKKGGPLIRSVEG